MKKSCSLCKDILKLLNDQSHSDVDKLDKRAVEVLRELIAHGFLARSQGSPCRKLLKAWAWPPNSAAKLPGFGSAFFALLPPPSFHSLKR